MVAAAMARSKVIRLNFPALSANCRRCELLRFTAFSRVFWRFFGVAQ
jgi:hypothetical protein